MKKNLLATLFCVMAFGIIGTKATITAHAEEVDINETDPNKVFPPEEVEKLVQEAKKLPVVPDPTIDDTPKAEGDHTRVKRNAGNGYPTRKGIILVTPDKALGIVPTGHAAIVYNTEKVVEANTGGVEMGKNNWNQSKSGVYGVIVNGTSANQQAQAADYAKRQEGKPYNWELYRMDHRHKFYCSHLVRSAYLDLYGIDLNTPAFDFGNAKAIHPMELATGSLATSIIYQK